MNKRSFELTNELQEFFTQVSEVIDQEEVEFEEVVKETPKRRKGAKSLGENKRTERYTLFFSKAEQEVIQALADKKNLTVVEYIHTLIKKASGGATSNA